ncbi:glucosaminidase domain-containing protein [Mariniphaga sediminis]|uniref:glucosaminidase domain-containing protein n=1 Tax=Mariniphaga sediminis TaxID=1628158 RepID=UPI003568B726
MKHVLILLLFITAGLTSQAQFTREQYIRKYQLLAIEEMGRSGIPASIKMAQACLESANGNSELSRKSNNHFGIKCKSYWKGQKVYYDDDARGECFRKYKSVEESYIDHTNFLMGNPRYAFLFKLPPEDYKGWAKGLKEAGYATARHYDKTLIKIIEDHKLYRLDYKQSLGQLPTYERPQQLNEGMSDRVAINPFNGRQVIKINGLKAVVARPDDTYEILAQATGIETWEIYKFNDRAAGYMPQPNEVVYIESKRRRAPRNQAFHTAEKGETMHFISQRYGIKLKPLYRRNRMEPGQQPNAGDVVYLRNKKPK